MSDEIEHEPLPGLPELLPPGEEILWQGRPAWRRLAREGFRLPWLAAYFGVFAVARGVSSFVVDGASLLGAVQDTLMVLPLAAVALAILTALAWAHARATVYTITSRRVVIRGGVALPITFNLPFRQLAEANARAGTDGGGDISLKLAGTNRLGWLYLWPHARPFRFAQAEPMLRCIDNVDAVSGLLGDAVWAAASAPARPRVTPFSGTMGEASTVMT